jgi:hypothetical protein
MGIAVFSKVNMATVPNPPVNTVVIGVDLDGLTKQKDSLGTITILSEPLSRPGLTLGVVDMSALTAPSTGTMILAIDLDLQLKMLDENQNIIPIGGGGGSVGLSDILTYNNDGNATPIKNVPSINTPSDQVIVDIVNRRLVRSDNTITFDWENLVMSDTAGNNVFLWDSQQLLDQTGQLSLRWSTRTMADENGNAAVIWDANRKLIDANSVDSILWNVRNLLDDTSTPTLDYQNRTLLKDHWQYDSDHSANYTNRSLVDKEYVDNLTPTISVNTTVANLQTLITNSALQIGTIYNVTNAQDVDYSNGERLIVTASTNNTIGPGIWKKVSRILPTGKFSIHGGTSGSINSVTINGNNLLTAVIPYNTSRYTTATDVANNINLNTNTHNWKAIVFNGHAATDFPTIVLEYQLPVTTSFVLATTQTTLTITASNNIIHPNNGELPKTLQLIAKYNPTIDRILYARDQENDVEVSVQESWITVFNPVKEFFWGNSRIKGWKSVNSDFASTYLLGTSSIVNNKFYDCTIYVPVSDLAFNECYRLNLNSISACSKFTFTYNKIGSFNTVSQALISNISGGRVASNSSVTISNNFFSPIFTSGAQNTLSISNIGVGATLAVSLVNNNFMNTTSVGGNTGSFSLNNNTFSVLTLTGTSTLNVAGNTVGNNTINIVGSGSTQITLTNNTFLGPVSIQGITGSNQNIILLNNIISASGITLSNIVLNAVLTLSRNMNVFFFSGSHTYNGTINVTDNIVASLNITGSGKTFGAITITNSEMYNIANWTNILNAAITINSSFIAAGTVIKIGDLTTVGTLNINDSRILTGSGNTTLIVPAGGTLIINNSDIYPISNIEVAAGQTLTIGSSTLRQVGINPSLGGYINYSDLSLMNFYNGGTTGAPENDFVGDYATSNFSLIETDTSGSSVVDSSPASVQILTGDDGSNNPGTTDYLTTVLRDGVLKFDWNFTTTDDTFVTTGFMINIDGSEYPVTGLIDGGGLNQTGTYTMNVSTGSSVGIRLYTLNDGLYTANVVVNNLVFRESKPAILQCTAAKISNSIVTITPPYNTHCALTNLDALGASITISGNDVSGNLNLINSTVKNSTLVNIADLSYDVQSLECVNSQLEIVGSSIDIDNMLCFNSKFTLGSSGYVIITSGNINNSLLMNRNYSIGSKTGPFMFIRSQIETSQIGIENLDNQGVPAIMNHNITDSRISNLLGSVNLGFGEKIYFLPNEMTFQNELAIISTLIDNRKFVYTTKITAPQAGNILTDFNSPIRGFVKTKISFMAAESVLTESIAGTIKLVTTNNGFGSTTDLNTPVSISTINTNKYVESTSIVGPVPSGLRRTFGIVLSNQLTGGQILMTLEGFLADSTL